MLKYIAILARRLKPGKTYDDFLSAWYPDKGFNWAGTGPLVARNVDDERETLTFGQFELVGDEDLEALLARVAKQEALRHDRIDEVIEETTVRGIYRVTDAFDFTDDETVAAGRPEIVTRNRIDGKRGT
ncbi:MAG: hypothetical protein AAGA28_18215 [Pseudomonadota bacterium]